MKYIVNIEVDEDGQFCASCPVLPGCFSDGATREEALANIAEAMVGYLESLKKAGDPFPSPVDEAVVEIDMGQIVC